MSLHLILLPLSYSRDFSSPTHLNCLPPCYQNHLHHLILLPLSYSRYFSSLPHLSHLLVIRTILLIILTPGPTLHVMLLLFLVSLLLIWVHAALGCHLIHICMYLLLFLLHLILFIQLLFYLRYHLSVFCCILLHLYSPLQGGASTY